MSSLPVAAASLLILSGCATPRETRASMGLISPDQKPAFLDLKDRLQSTKGAADTTNKAEVRLVENQHNEATTRGFTVVQDEPERIRGGSRGPTPTDYFTAAVGFCENVVFVRNAALLDLSINSLDTSVAGTWDMKGLFGIDGVQSAFTTITVESRVTTKDPVEKVVEVAISTWV